MRTVAALKRWRRRTLRFVNEHAMIDMWLATITGLARADYELAVEVAKYQQLVRGHGDTHSRGLAKFQAVIDAARRLARRQGAAGIVGRRRRVAEAGDRGEAAATELATLGFA